MISHAMSICQLFMSQYLPNLQILELQFPFKKHKAVFFLYQLQIRIVSVGFQAVNSGNQKGWFINGAVQKPIFITGFGARSHWFFKVIKLRVTVKTQRPHVHILPPFGFIKINDRPLAVSFDFWHHKRRINQ